MDLSKCAPCHLSFVPPPYTHGVGSVTGLIICLATSSSALTIPRKDTGRRRGGLTTGTLSECIWIVYSPGSLPRPLNTSGGVMPGHMQYGNHSGHKLLVCLQGKLYLV